LNSDLIQRVATKLILPFIVLFALYVQFHGETSPGGGFQAGVITAAAVILISITFGQTTAKKIAPWSIVEIGVLITVAGTMIALFYAFVERGR
jgi:multicomponent Na+:H+ antiporter subunit B